jgi:hypothetical protein
VGVLVTDSRRACGRPATNGFTAWPRRAPFPRGVLLLRGGRCDVAATAFRGRRRGLVGPAGAVPQRQVPPRKRGPEGRNDARTGMPARVLAGAMCVQRFDDSLNSAIHITYRISLRSSSMPEPRDPLLKVLIHSPTAVAGRRVHSEEMPPVKCSRRVSSGVLRRAPWCPGRTRCGVRRRGESPPRQR